MAKHLRRGGQGNPTSRSSREACDEGTSGLSIVTSTHAQNEFGRVFDSAIRGRDVVITKHGRAKAVLISKDRFDQLARREAAVLEALDAQFDEMVANMQTPGARAATERLFDASPQELGQAAVAGAKRRKGD